MSDLYALDAFPDEGWAEIRFFSMNTLVRMRGWASSDSEDEMGVLEFALQQAHATCLRYEELMSRTVPESDVSRVNASAGEAVRVSTETAQVVREALAYCERSGGAFDITIGALTTLWDFHSGHVPAPEEVSAAKIHVDHGNVEVEVDGDESAIRLLDPDAKIDLGGIAKGWAADMLLDQLMASGLIGALVDMGGNVAVRGSKPDGSIWKIGIKEPESPFGSERLLGVVEMESGSVATSGVYERCFEKDGRLFHHILDPQTGYPLETKWKAVSVVADTALDAEGFSTALLSLNEDEARVLVEGFPEVRQVFFIDEEHRMTALYPDGAEGALIG